MVKVAFKWTFQNLAVSVLDFVVTDLMSLQVAVTLATGVLTPPNQEVKVLDVAQVIQVYLWRGQGLCGLLMQLHV
jgi:hypothetical protein